MWRRRSKDELRVLASTLSSLTKKADPRKVNNASWSTIALVGMRSDAHKREYVARHMLEGLRMKEISRLLKRAIAREHYSLILADLRTLGFSLDIGASPQSNDVRANIARGSDVTQEAHIVGGVRCPKSRAEILCQRFNASDLLNSKTTEIYLYEEIKLDLCRMRR